jgi:UDP-N-acetylglucosamine--N-acetylmuramyl-(pentapeptide) pyrophosphoryl-undecaprenol N-acetylglucosamine transferase
MAGVLKVGITGGGTGGHVYPGIAVAEEIVRRGGEAFFVGTERGLESRIVPGAGFRLVTIPAAPVLRDKFARNLANALVNARGLAAAIGVLRREEADIVLGTGGYVSFATCFAARLLGTPVVLHEQNAVAGLANRALARVASVVLTAWDLDARPLGTHARRVCVGLPVRTDFSRFTRDAARRRLGIGADERVLVIFGGSRGAASLNAAAEAALSRWEEAGVTVIWGTGGDHYDQIGRRLAGAIRRARVLPYIDDMPSALAAADLAVTRAGAMTLAELWATATPSILVPYPHATADHQTANALRSESAGAGVMIPDAKVAERLYDEVGALLSDRERLSRMSQKARLLGRRDAAEQIVDILEEVAARP